MNLDDAAPANEPANEATARGTGEQCCKYMVRSSARPPADINLVSMRVSLAAPVDSVTKIG